MISLPWFGSAHGCLHPQRLRAVTGRRVASPSMALLSGPLTVTRDSQRDADHSLRTDFQYFIIASAIGQAWGNRCLIFPRV